MHPLTILAVEQRLMTVTLACQTCFVLQNLSQQEALPMSLMSHAAQHAHHRAHISDVFDTMAFIAHLKSLQILTEIRSPSNVRITKLIGL
jgi:hypothetical protein